MILEKVFQLSWSIYFSGKAGEISFKRVKLIIKFKKERATFFDERKGECSQKGPGKTVDNFI